MIGIYKITNTINGKVYIGQAQDIEKRREEHIRDSKSGQQVIYRAMRKYGIENFSFEVLIEIEEELLDLMEIYYIEKFNSYVHAKNSNGYNMTLGGRTTRVYRHTKETKEKMSKIKKGNVVVTEETRRKISEAIKGRKHREETKEKISMSNKGRTLTEEHKASVSKAHKGKPLTKKHREKLKESHKGKHDGGKNSQARKIECENKQFGCIKECAEYYGVGYSAMKNWLNGYSKMRQEFIEMGLKYIE